MAEERSYLTAFLIFVQDKTGAVIPLLVTVLFMRERDMRGKKVIVFPSSFIYCQ